MVRGGVSTADLDAHSSAVVTSGDVQASSEGDAATVRFVWSVDGPGDPLVMALPHHVDILQGAQTVGLTYNVIKGEMVGVVGREWTMGEPLTTLGFFSANEVDPARVGQIRDALNQDLSFEAQTLDPYFGGKQVML